MIQLHIANLTALLRQHYADVGPLVQGRIQLFTDVLNAECRRRYVPAQPAPSTARYNLHHKHLSACVGAICPSGTGTVSNERIFDCITGAVPLGINTQYRPLATKILKLLSEVAKKAELLLTGEPAQLEALATHIRSRYPTLLTGDTFAPPVHTLLAQVFDYEYFSQRPPDKWGAFQLTKGLNIMVCPYCNHNYTLTIHEVPASGIARTIRPHLDHFFNQARYPLLGVSFYNLIPCCSVCNSSLKGGRLFTLQTHVHPYLYGFGMQGRFRHTLIATTPEQPDPAVAIQLEINTGPRSTQITGSAESFLLKDMYRYHTDIVREMLFKQRAYSDDYLQVLARQYQALNLSPIQLYQQAFGAYLREEEFGRRPLSKLIRDLAIDMQMIPEPSVS
jgi:hypothetical protein